MIHKEKFRWWCSFALIGLFISLVVPLQQAPQVYAASSLGSCQFISASEVGNCSFTGINFNGSGKSFSFTTTCHSPGLFGSYNFSITVGSKISSGGYNGTIQTIMSGSTGGTCNGPTGLYNGAITISDPSGYGPGGGNPGSGGNGGNNAPSPQLVCTTDFFNPLTWLICPLISAAQGAIEGLTAGIDSLLSINTQEIFGTNNTPAQGSTSAGFYKAWNTFRLFGAGLIVIAGLIMLIAQAMGSDFIDAYTIHKVLPRILIALIGISLSWWLLAFAINLSNDIGLGIRSIIYAPFEGFGHTVRVNGGAATVGAIVGTATFLVLGLLGIASFMFTALLAIFVGFVVLFIRQVIIMMLVIFAPLAIACYVLPGTQKAWAFWKDTFLSMLIVFPIISAMIAMGRVFAVVMYNNHTSGIPTFVNEIGAFIVYFAPYFLLPAAFRWAGGAMASIGGLVNDRHRGAFDRLKGFRKNQAASRYERAKGNNLYRGKNRLSKAINTLAWGGTNLNKAGYNPSKWSSRLHEAGTVGAYAEAKEMLEKNPALGVIKNNNAALGAARMLAGGKSKADVEAWLKNPNGGDIEDTEVLRQTMTQAETFQKSGGNKAVQIASIMADAISTTGWQHDKGALAKGIVGTAWQKYANDIADVADGDKSLAQLIYGDTRGALARARPELAAQSYATGFAEIQNVMKASGTQDERDALAISGGTRVAQDAFMHSDSGTIFRAKDYSQEALFKVASQQVLGQQANAGQVDPDLSAHIGDITAGLANAKQGVVWASPQAVKILRETIDSSPSVKADVDKAVSNSRGQDIPRDIIQPPEGG